MPENSNSMVTDFSNIIRQIENKGILLPDFQREFVWRDEEMQKKLVASVLAKMPVGSILLLHGSPSDYQSKSIGRKNAVDVTNLNDVDFLLDGQQRITVLSNVFSSVIFDHSVNFSNLVSPALKRRFFLKIPKWKNSKDEKDLFHIRTLQFPNEYTYSDPDFLSGDIYDSIIVYNFTANDDKPFNPNKEPSVDLYNFCTNQEDGYLIPLYLLIATGENIQQRQSIRLALETIIENIATSIEQEIELELTSKPVGSDCRNALIDEIFASFSDSDRAWMKDNDTKEFEATINGNNRAWRSLMKEYLSSCIQSMRLTQIRVGDSQRARAIDIYENLNRGGVSLSTFDLIMARVAKVDTQNFYKRIVEAMKKVHDYPLAVAPTSTRNILAPMITTHSYNATLRCGCYNESKNEIVSKYIDVFLDVLGLYSQNTNFEPDKYRVDHIKKDCILRIDPIFIHQNCEKVIQALDRALFFFQTRCGIRNITDINYSLMFVLVATVFLKDEYFADEKCHELLEAWYWSILFSGEYDKDQNSDMIRDLSNIVASLQQNKAVSVWLTPSRSNIFKLNFFSDKDLLLMKRAQTEERYPKMVMRSFICQYYLSKVYPCLFDPQKRVSVFADFANDLEAHHIIPLGSVATINESTKSLRADDSHQCNSPLNFCYITKEDNLMIGSKSLPDYVLLVNDIALSKLNINTTFNSIDFSNEQEVLTVLDNRFSATKGDVEGRIDDCLISWS